MQCHPFVSIVVPAHNAAEFVGDTIGSIQQQTFEEWECVIVDDGSTDETAAVVLNEIRGDSRFRLIRQERFGVSVARNRGFYETSRNARFVSFMDADDRWCRDALEVLLKGASRSGGIIGAHALGRFIGRDGRLESEGEFEAFGRRRLGYQEGKIRVWPLENATCFATLCWADPMYPPGVLLVRRKIYEIVGLFDQSMRLCEDWDMAIRLSRQGDIGFENQVVLEYRRHSRNASLDVRGNQIAVRRLHHKTFFSPENTPEQKRILREGWLAWQKFKISEKWSAARKGVEEGAIGKSLEALFSTPLYVLRYLRGVPGRGLI